MKVNVTNLGGGLTRLEIEPSCGCEPRVIPTCVADDIMRDVVKREKNGGHCNCTPSWSRPVATRVARPVFTQNSTMGRPLPTPPNRGVESGIDAHIDRPLRQNYGGLQWVAEEAYRRDMAKYNTAVSAIKACDWPCKEDLNGVPRSMSQHNPNPQTQFIGVPNYCNHDAPIHRASCGCNNKTEIRHALGVLATLVEQML